MNHLNHNLFFIYDFEIYLQTFLFHDKINNPRHRAIIFYIKTKFLYFFFIYIYRFLVYQPKYNKYKKNPRNWWKNHVCRFIETKHDVSKKKKKRGWQRKPWKAQKIKTQEMKACRKRGYRGRRISRAWNWESLEGKVKTRIYRVLLYSWNIYWESNLEVETNKKKLTYKNNN